MTKDDIFKPGDVVDLDLSLSPSLAPREGIHWRGLILLRLNKRRVFPYYKVKILRTAASYLKVGDVVEVASFCLRLVSPLEQLAEAGL